MTLSQSELDLYNLAMDDIGQTPIESSDDATPGADVAERRYRHCVGYLLDLRAWSFNRFYTQLSQLEAAPTSGYLYAYNYGSATPPLGVFDRLSPLRPFREFIIADNELHTDAEELWAVLPSDGDPGRWPQHFRTLVTTYIAAKACLQHTGSRTLADDLMTTAMGTPQDRPWGGLCGASRAIDSQYEEQTALTIAPGGLLGARS